MLESRRFRRLGGTRELEVNVRLVAATNQDLVRKVRDGSFRADLFHRVNVLPLRLPPLRGPRPRGDRRPAVRMLADFRRPSGRGPARLSHDALAALVRYMWSDNIRELRNTLERVLLLHARTGAL